MIFMFFSYLQDKNTSLCYKTQFKNFLNSKNIYFDFLCVYVCVCGSICENMLRHFVYSSFCFIIFCSKAMSVDIENWLFDYE